MEDIRAHGWQIGVAIVAIVVYIRVVHVLYRGNQTFISDNTILPFFGRSEDIIKMKNKPIKEGFKI
jgi:hypothetical protein